MKFSNIFNKSNYIAFIKTAKETTLRSLIYRCFSIAKDSLKYPKWYAQQINSEDELTSQRNTIFPYSPLISIVVPTFCTPIPFLREMIDSVINQSYSNWELCIADASITDSKVRNVLKDYEVLDSRIHVIYLDDNKSISENTNSAISISTGEYIGLLDHDDILAPNTLFEIVQILNNDSTIDVLYTDEDKIDMDSTNHYYPNFKPDYNSFLLRSYNYICHFFIFKRTIWDAIGSFNPEFNGSQDYDYILRATTIAKHIHHIPKILYHWRVHSGSVASNPTQKNYCYDAAKRAIQQNLNTIGISADVSHARLLGCYNTTYHFKDLSSITIFSPEPEFNIPDDDNSFIHICTIGTIKPQHIEKNIINSDKAFCVFLNKGITSISMNTLLKMISYFEDKKVGATTPKIVRHGKTLSLGMTYDKGKLKNCYSSVPSDDAGFYGRNLLDQNVPICSANAFVCKQDVLYNFINQISADTTLSLTELAVLFSLYLTKQNLSIIGTANIHVESSLALPIISPTELLQKEEKTLIQISKLYSLPPYYN